MLGTMWLALVPRCALRSRDRLPIPLGFLEPTMDERRGDLKMSGDLDLGLPLAKHTEDLGSRDVVAILVMRPFQKLWSRVAWRRALSASSRRSLASMVMTAPAVILLATDPVPESPPPHSEPQPGGPQNRNAGKQGLGLVLAPMREEHGSFLHRQESNLPISQTLPDIEGWWGRRRL